jgi:hypothetical protein
MIMAAPALSPGGYTATPTDTSLMAKYPWNRYTIDPNSQNSYSWNITPNSSTQPTSTSQFDPNNPDFLSGLLNPSSSGGTGSGVLDTTSKSPFDPNTVPNSLSKSAYTYGGNNALPEQYFQDYIKSISAPSSVEEAQRGIESDILTQTLSDIDLDTKKQLADATMGFQERGLGGPGQTSDIESNALAQIQAGGAKTAAGARTTMAQSEIEREKQKEAAQQAAYGQRYTSAQQGAMQDVSTMNDLLKTQYTQSMQAGESEAQRESTLKQSLAQITDADKRQYYSQLLDSLLKNKSIDEASTEFFAKLDFDAQQGSYNRTAAYNQAVLGKSQQGTDSTLGQIGQGIGIATSLLGTGTRGGLLS